MPTMLMIASAKTTATAPRRSSAIERPEDAGRTAGPSVAGAGRGVAVVAGHHRVADVARRRHVAGRDVAGLAEGDRGDGQEGRREGVDDVGDDHRSGAE